MARKKFPKDEDFGEFEKIDVGPQPDAGMGESGFVQGLQSKIQTVTKRSLSVMKLLLGLSFMTFVYSSTVAFIGEFSRVELKSCRRRFGKGWSDS